MATLIPKLKELARVFLKLGVTSFGGPAAHIAMMEEEIVRKRQWMTRHQFMDLLGATQLIPGPNSTEMAMHCGFLRTGLIGLLVAGTCFILPAVMITTILAYVYVKLGTLPNINAFFYGIRPAVVVIIAQAIVRLWPSAVKGMNSVVVFGVVLAMCFITQNEVFSIFVGAIAGAWFLYLCDKGGAHKHAVLATTPFLLKGQSLGESMAPTMWGVNLLGIFGVFLKIGCILYGSGYVLVAYLQDELVDHRGWITHTQLMDAVAVGQFTPGPVLSAAAFVGYLLHGFPGAVVASLGIFLPSFFFVWALNPWLVKMRQGTIAAYLLDGVNISALAAMAAVVVRLSAQMMGDWHLLLIAALSVIALYKRISPPVVVVGSAVAGLVLNNS
jgi:chromate transporter